MSTSEEIISALDSSMLQHRHRLRRDFKRLGAVSATHRDNEQWRQFQARLKSSVATARARAAAVPNIAYPEELPISARSEEVVKAISRHPVLILAGETGSGKTTQLPKMCLQAGRGIFGKIAHTQPRRLAARSVAQRIADELNVSLGQQIGYQVRFSDQASEHTMVKLMTDGILLAEIQRDPYLNQYDTIIIDEAHERSLNIDFLLGYLKKLLQKRPDLKLIVTSATIDLQRFSSHFNNAPVIEVSGRTYPVEVRYQPLAESAQRNGVDADLDTLSTAILNAIDEIRTMDRLSSGNDILVFLSGERDIREITKALKQKNYPDLEILPLYSRLSASEQLRVFKPHPGQRVVLATNVAETSITVPGIRYVIDPGYARVSRYSVRSGIQGLPIEPISQASANQRAGRCGRVAEGVCIRLYDEQDFLSRAPFTDAEIVRTNLASVILQMLNLGLGDVNRFPFIDTPEASAIKGGYQVLRELGAISPGNKLTKNGRYLAKIPLDPRLARMVLEASKNGSLAEILVITAALAVQDPRERPLDKRQAADEKHKHYADDDSDFITFITLWQRIEEHRQSLSQNQFRKYCSKNFLNYMRIREWRDVHRQLVLVCKELGLALNQQPSGYAGIHRALLSGLLNHLGTLDTKQEYLGARNRRFTIFPGSSLFKKTPKWLMAAEIVETNRVYARCVAKIDPKWIQPLAQHMVKRQYAEPHWNADRGQVIAQETVLLYGLRVAANNVDYSQIDRGIARDLFIRHGLVDEQLKSRAEFFVANKALRQELLEVEEKSRRRDILVDDEALVTFYAARVPDEICSRNALQHWYKKAPKEQRDRLFMARSDLLRDESGLDVLAQYPNELLVGKTNCRLEYSFSPGETGDGVTLILPIALLNQVSERRLQWLVPGMLREMCIALVKLLPKTLRKQLVPVPTYVDRALAEMVFAQGGLAESLSLAMRRVAGVEIKPNEWSMARLEPFYRFNIRILDAQNRVVRQGRDLQKLRDKLKLQVSETIQQADDRDFARRNVTSWDFGELLQPAEVKQGGITLTLHTALVEQDGTLNLIGVDSLHQAKARSTLGVLTLMMAQTPDQQRYLRKHIRQLEDIQLYYAAFGDKAELETGLVKAVYRLTFLEDRELPIDSSGFRERLTAHKGELVAKFNQYCDLVREVMQLHHEIAHKMEQTAPPPWAFVYQDIALQLQRLFPTEFLADTPFSRLRHYPRYLQAVLQRLDKIQNQLDKEKLWCHQFEEYWQKYNAEKERRAQRQQTVEPVIEFRWMLEEFRVSLYAQALGTAMPISAKRLDKYYRNLENS